MDGDYNKPFENFKNTSIIPPAYGGHNFSVELKIHMVIGGQYIQLEYI